MMKTKSLYVMSATIATVGLLLPLNGQPLLAQAVRKGSQAVQNVISQPRMQLNLSVEKQVQTTQQGKPQIQWQALNAKQAAVVPGNVLRYQVLASNTGNATAQNFAITQAIPARTVFVGNSVTVAKGVNAQVTYSIDQGKTFSDRPLQNIQGKSQPAPAEAYTHLRIKLNQPVAPKATISAQYQVRVR